jgi:hypothetical protein
MLVIGLFSVASYLEATRAPVVCGIVQAKLNGFQIIMWCYELCLKQYSMQALSNHLLYTF